MPIIDQDKYPKASVLKKSSYIFSDCDKEPQLILMGTGSEVHLLLEAEEKLKAAYIQVRVVSFPCRELFEKQSGDYKQNIFPKNIRKRLTVEAGSPTGWCKNVTDEGDIIGIT